jgi:hypothetical protein
VRRLNEFLLFSNEDPARPIIRPRYIGSSTVRGIPVEQWETCLIDKTQYRTVRRLWSFARSDVNMPIGAVNDMAVPVQGLVSASIVSPDGTQNIEIDEVFNILSYKPGIIETPDSLAPPKGVFCSNSESIQNLVSLSEVGVSWPRRFSVRIDVSTSRSSQWQTFHLRIDQNRERKRIRYDYVPTGEEDFRTIILDYKDNLTYSIDRQLGSCVITTGTEYPDVSPTRKPIEFFIKHENMLISKPMEKAWEFNGYRSEFFNDFRNDHTAQLSIFISECRGQAIQCAIFTASADQFPAIVDSDTDITTGEFWAMSNIEYGWSVRAPLSASSIDHPKQFDYPVHLFLRMFRYDDPNNPTPSTMRTDDIEYEFYEMSDDVHMSEFDTSICYRSLNLPYLHLGFVIKISNDSLVDGNHLDRHALERNVENSLVNGLQVSETRISKIELDHIRYDNSFYVLFTLLGPVSLPNSEPSVETARERLQATIDAGSFSFNMTLLDYDRSQVVFRAQTNSLKASKQFMSIHASWVYANVSSCNVSNANFSNCNVSSTNFSICNANNSHVNRPRIKQEKYTLGAQAGGIIGGLILGIALGFIVIFIVRFIRKNRTPAGPSIATGGLNNASFHKTRLLPPIRMNDLHGDAGDTSRA